LEIFCPDRPGLQAVSIRIGRFEMAKKLTIVLAGNPNSGKTTIFNNLTGARQHVGNWPGVTVEKKQGTCKYNGYEIRVIDLPGTYSLTAYSIEEVVARDFIIKEKPDVVVDIVDASNLQRNLYLTTQFKELEAKVVIALNMSDLAEKNGVSIDVDKMSHLIGVPVVPTVGNKNQGMKELMEAVVNTAEDNIGIEEHILRFGKEVDPEIEKIQRIISKDSNLISQYSPSWLAIKLLENDSEIIKVVETSAFWEEIRSAVAKSQSYIKDHIGDDAVTLIADQRYGFIAGLAAEAVQKPAFERLSVSDKIDKVITNRVLGLPIFLLIMYVILKFTFSGSEFMVGWFESFFGWLGDVASAAIPEGMFQSFIVDGIIAGVGGVLGFFPLVLFLFMGIAILEDSGYMARGAFVMDKIMHVFGLHGKSFLPLLIGMGCTVPALMASRTLESRKDRLITMLVNGFIICGAKIPIYALFLGAFFFKSGATVFFLFYVIGVAFAVLMAKLFRVFLLPGEATPFIMELPPYRVPTVKGVLIHMWERSWMYLRKAGTIILAIAVIIWFGFSFPQEPEYSKDYEAMKVRIEKSYAGRLGHAVAPLFRPLGFDWRSSLALLAGFAAKEVVVATFGTLYSMGETDPEEAGSLREAIQKDPSWTPLKAFTFMIFCLLYIPCFVAMAVFHREAGSWKWTGFMVLYTTLLAWVASFIVYQGGMLLGLD
jgi:ferrous iron transport protein B